MKQKNFPSLLLTALLLTGALAHGQDQGTSLFSQIKVRPGIQLDYLSRTVSPKDEDTEDRIKSYFISLNMELQIVEGFSLNPMVGYSFNNFNGMTFRKLPVSLEVDAGEIGGFLIGLGMQKSFLQFRNLEIDLVGQLLYSFPRQQTWSIPGLAVNGSAEGKPQWLMIQAGPLFRYTGIAYFLPYVSIGYDRMWGRFQMNEIIQDLQGTEEKSVSSLSHLNITLGFDYAITEALSVKVQGALLPYTDFKQTDFSILVRLIYALF